MEKQLIDFAYDLAKTKYAKKPFTFEKLWKELVKQAKLSKEEQALAGYVYTAMLQDHRFIFVGDSQWRITEFLTEDEQSTYANALYDFKKEAEEEKERIKKLNKRDEDDLYVDEETEAEYSNKKSGQLEEDEDEEEEHEDEEDDKEPSSEE